MFPVAILAGGLATRLYPITEKIPKALVDIGGEPFIIRQLKYLKEQGVTDVVLCIGHLGHMIEDVVGNGSRLGLRVEYSFDGDVLLGTGGAIKKATPLLGSAFFILYGDSFLPINFLDVYEAFIKSERVALMTVYKNNNSLDASNVMFRNGRLIEYNKTTPNGSMDYIDYGLSVVYTNIFEAYPVGCKFDLADVFCGLSIKDAVAGYEVFDRFYEIGSHIGLKETEEYFLKKENV